MFGLHFAVIILGKVVNLFPLMTCMDTLPDTLRVQRDAVTHHLALAKDSTPLNYTTTLDMDGWVFEVRCIHLSPPPLPYSTPLGLARRSFKTPPHSL